MTDLEKALELARYSPEHPISSALISLHAECDEWKQQAQWSMDNEFRLSDEIKKLKADNAALKAVADAARKLGGVRHFTGTAPDYIEIQCDQGWDELREKLIALDAKEGS